MKLMPLDQAQLNKNSLTTVLSNIIPTRIHNYNVVFFCIGSDRSTGDSLGPLVGSFLTDKGYSNVMGTLDEPIHAQNLEEKINEIPKNKTIIVIDASLGIRKDIGKVFVASGGLEPGLGVGKKLNSIGDYSIKGIVNVRGPLVNQVLQSTRLSVVMKIAEEIAQGLAYRFPLTSNNRFYSNNKIKLTV